MFRKNCQKKNDLKSNKAPSPSGKAQDFDSCIHWFDSSSGCSVLSFALHLTKSPFDVLPTSGMLLRCVTSAGGFVRIILSRIRQNSVVAFDNLT